MTSFLLKIIAVITMLIDHTGYLVYHKLSYFNYIGRFAFPIFAFQLSEGYLHTKNLKKYLIRLGIFAVLSQIPYLLFKTIYTTPPLTLFEMPLNIFFTLLLGLAAILIYDKTEFGPSLNCKFFKLKFFPILIVAGICYLAELIHVDYGYFGVLLVFVFYLLKENKILMLLGYTAAVAIYFFPYLLKSNFYFPYIMLTLCTFLSIVPILCYNKKQGKKLKYALYIFYPAHLLIIYFLNFLF